jgi:tetratricopeptide (TPR) repeat protein
MNPSKEHNNWITVGEIIRLIKEPVTLYTSEVIKKWHAKLCSNPSLSSLRGCTNPTVCPQKTNPSNLCPSCKGWYDELAESHQNRDKRKISWHQNCNPLEWRVDPWEVAKFYMPVLGDNKNTVKDAESTDLSSLLNVLFWIKDAAFDPRRVDLNFVEELRKVRNDWAHAPKQELTDTNLNDAFDTAKKFVDDLDKVFSLPEVQKCLKDINFLQAHGLTNVAETKLKILELLSVEIGGDVNKNKQDIKSLQDNIKSLRDIINGQERSQLKSCIPEKPATFIGRDTKVKEIISSLVEKDCGIVSIVGGPGFGKSTVAVEVSHQISNNHDIVVIFSYLSNVSTVPEVIVRLCQDVGVKPGEDPESALMLWVKNIERKVVLVMDNIEQLLESNVKSRFTELVLTFRKNSQQRLQILTTTRTEFSISGQTTGNEQIGVLDEKSSVELLKNYCPDEEVEDAYLSELAGLCGFVPLALCIAGPLIPALDDPLDLIQFLKEKPLETLKNSKECVRQAIEFSFQKLSDKDKKAFVRLSVFDGDFQRKSAQEVIEKDVLETHNVLQNLKNRSLIQSSRDKWFIIHSLIRRFLVDQLEKDEKAIAEGLMVGHFLKLCHSLTVESYTKNKFTSARESLKKDVHNVKETLKICTQEESTNPKQKVLEILGRSDIYKSSSRFFYDFCWDLLPQTVLRNFFESCIKLAESRKQPAIQIIFQCLVADQEGRKTAWSRSSAEYVSRMEGIKETLQKNKEVLKEDWSLFMFCYYFYARYDPDEAIDSPYPDPPEDNVVSMAENKAPNLFESVSEVLILRERGNLKKKHANRIYHTDNEKYEQFMDCAKSLYNKALSLAKDRLGDHEVTCILYKVLGDLYFGRRINEEALPYYSNAIKLRKKLKLDSNEPFVFLLKNYGACLSYLRRFDESLEKLNEARDIADKLAEKHTPCRAKVYYQLAQLFWYWKSNCEEATEYAEKAMEMRELLDSRSVKDLEKIIKTAEENE